MKTKMILLTFTFIIGSYLLGCGSRGSESAEGNETKAHDENIVTLSEDALKNITLKIEPVEVGNLGLTLKVAGRVSPNLNKTAKISPTLEGRITKLTVDVGDKVKKGDVLAVLESPELVGRALEIHSPIDGVLTNRAATTGELLDKGKDFLTVSDPTDLWVIAEVKEKDIAALKVGQKATFSVLSYPDKKFSGTIIRLGSEVEEDSRTLEARINVDKDQALLKPGMFADVSLVTTMLEGVITIPDEALQTEGDEQVVFVALDDHQFEKRVVKVGLEEGAKVQILDGIGKGDNVVTLGSFVLKSEMLKGELGEE